MIDAELGASAIEVCVGVVPVAPFPVAVMVTGELIAVPVIVMVLVSRPATEG